MESDSTIQFGWLEIRIVDDSICRPALPTLGIKRLSLNYGLNIWDGILQALLSHFYFLVGLVIGKVLVKSRGSRFLGLTNLTTESITIPQSRGNFP